MIETPKIENAPGLKWKPRKDGCEARWECRADIRERGYPIKSHGIRVFYVNKPLTPEDIAYIQERCQAQQADMLAWSHGGVPTVSTFDGTIQGLIDGYFNDPDSSYRQPKPKRYQTRRYYTTVCKMIARSEWTDDSGAVRTIGATQVSEVKARLLLRWHRAWAEGGKVARAHSLMGMLRTICTFGKTILEDEECTRLSSILSDMKWPQAVARDEALSAEQAELVRVEANRRGLHSIALAQAIQFEGTLRQKDVIGEWIPIEDPGMSDTMNGSKKWLRGVRWEEINENFILTHVTSKRNKEVTIDLKLASMVMAQLENKPREAFPASGPIIVRESTGRPWDPNEFRKFWREIATAVGIPNAVRNMDSRAGAITEALAAGADLDGVRKSATHSDVGMTQRYSRGDEEAIAKVMKLRTASRNEPGK